MFRRLVTLDEAQQTILKHFKPKPVGVEEAPLLEAHNRVLAQNMIATLDIPPFNRSTVDGYAVKAEDTFGADEKRPAMLRVYGTASIGKLPAVRVASGKAAEIVTGAPMPEGADAVVMAEDTERKGNCIYVFAAVAKDENTMKAGSDIQKGKTVLRTGQLLGSREIGVLAAVGVARVKVYAFPRVAVLSTGAEVTEPGRRLLPGRIYDINAYSLSAAIAESGGKPILMGVFPDRRSRLKKALVEALNTADVVVTSGGVSVGPKDIMPQIVGSLGTPGVIVSGIAIKPGKPATVAVVNGKPVFSLPGHPTSALLVFQLLARPIISIMAGKKAERSLKMRAFAGMRMFAARGRRTFVMVKLRRDKSDRLVADAVESGQSGAITTLAKADGFVEVAENQQFADADEDVVVQLFRSYEKDGFLAN